MSRFPLPEQDPCYFCDIVAGRINQWQVIEKAALTMTLLNGRQFEIGQCVIVPRRHAPTILDLMGVAAEPKIQGRTVIPMVLRAGPWLPRVVSLEYGRSYALRGTRFKYIVDYQQRESVFDLVEDPTEQTDLLETQPIAVRYLRDLAGFFLVHRSKWHTARMGDWNNHSEGFLEYLGDQP